MASEIESDFSAITGWLSVVARLLTGISSEGEPRSGRCCSMLLKVGRSKSGVKRMEQVLP